MELSLTHAIDNLGKVSQQFVYPSNIAFDLDDLLTTNDLSESTPLKEEIQSELEYISYANSSAGLTMLMEEDGTHLFRNMPVRANFDLEMLPILDEAHDVTFYGPHISNNRLHSQYALSVVREVDLPSGKPLYVYVESNFNITQSILESNQMDNNSFYLLLNEDNKIIFSELNSLFPLGSNFEGSIKGGDTSGVLEDYYWFRDNTNQGWSIVSLVPQSEYNKEKDRWIAQMLVLAIVFGIFSLFIAWLVWKMVYKPIRHFDAEISAISEDNLHTQAIPTKVPEFDELLHQLQNMKTQVSDLLEEVELKEKNRADLEIEKLMYQINPHFLMNTLDSVRWLAVLNNQDEINRIASSLNKLLYYNLKRNGKVSTLEEELDSINQYCNLQAIRHQFTYDESINVGSNLLKTPIPKFILQPIVENAIYHGLADEDGCIEVKVEQEENNLVVSIYDNGAGLSEEEKSHILSDEKEGIGIGMNYVKGMLESYYDGKASIDIISGDQQGTTVLLSIPIK
ncbi:sensor histidine kinase [Halobacillus andaensis]|uniref:sensor histidine kinase n=1 Tax=Halobacillus andaensis TaxID=1176239 RepID=UPI003D73181D